MDNMLVWLLALLHITAANYSANITVDTELSTHDLPAVRLYNKIMKELPDPSIRPVKSINVPTVIDMVITLQQLVEVDDIEQKVKLIIPMVYKWKSDFVKWDPEEYGGITKMNIDPAKIWTPKVFAATSVENLRSPEDLEDMVEVSHNGSMKWLSYKMVTFSCEMDMSQFPSDSHQCLMVMMFMGDKFPSVMFGSATAQTSKYTLPNTEFNVTSFTMRNFFSISVLEMNITRNPSLASTTLISPLIFLSILPPASLLLPPDDGSKLDIQINAMLAYAVYMMILSDYLPPFADDQTPEIVSNVLKLIGGNLAAILYTIIILRITHFDEKSPNKYIYKGFKVIGKLLLIYHPDAVCETRSKITESSTVIKVLPMQEEKENTTPNFNNDERATSMHRIAEWLNDKSETDDIKYQWCYIAAVLDRITFIVMMSFGIYVSCNLTVMNRVE